VSRLADLVRSSVVAGFEAQATAHGAEVHRRAVEMRARDPLATFLLDTFDRQVRDRASGAHAAQRAGDHKRALELARSCEMAGANAARVRAAINGEV
jgi:hypothetical protein